jgi:hypothetical protein
MAIPVFGLTHTSVHDHYFPSLVAFSASTKPTATIVGEMITNVAAELIGRLAAVHVTGATISTDAGATYPSAYAWCATYIRQGAAIAVMEAIAGAGAVPEAWQKVQDQRNKDLKEFGYLILGDAPAPSEQASGPRSHGTHNNLTADSSEDMSSMVPIFRRSDKL